MTKQQKYIAYSGAGILALYLLYRWYQSRQSGAATATTSGGVDTSGLSSGLAGVSGQEQADIAALQGQEQQDIASLQAARATDLASLQGGLSQASGQESADIASLNAQLASMMGSGNWAQNLQATVAQTAAQFAAQQTQLQQVLAGEAGLSRTLTNQGKTINTLRKQVQKLQPKKKLGGNAHSSHHQAGNAGHTGGHAGGSVAARSHHTRTAGTTHTITHPEREARAAPPPAPHPTAHTPPRRAGRRRR